MVQRLLILGSTGSIGENVLDVVERNPDSFIVWGLTAHRNISRLLLQCQRFKPRIAIVSEAHHAIELQGLLQANGLTTEVYCGVEAMCDAARSTECDTVVAAIVGAAGLLPTLSAAESGKRILLANKEALVMSGGLFIDACRASGALVVPVDSEHSAIFQCLHGVEDKQANVERLILTASGGPFRTCPLSTLEHVTPDQACAHPCWVMGRKISVDSATMMNKGLEVIEARWLFDMATERIDILIHPQSIIHSMVVFRDQSVLAQMGNPDMRVPIAYALAYPGRFDSGAAPLDLAKIAALTFEPLDLQRYPCLALALEVIRAGGHAAPILNASNEVAVEAFLTRRLTFTDIAPVIERVLTHLSSSQTRTFDDILALDENARRFASETVRHMSV